MTQMVTLLQREVLEHRSSLVWTQLGIGAAIFLLCLLAVVTATVTIQMDSGHDFSFGFDNGASRQNQHSNDIRIQMGDNSPEPHQELNNQKEAGQGVAVGELVHKGLERLKGVSFEERQRLIRSGRYSVSVLFQFVLSLVLFFYLIGSLYAERADRSVLFWKSMPVSDLMCVLSKLLIALLIAPAIAIIAILFTQLLLFTLATLFAWSGGFSAWDLLWAPSGIVTGFLGLIIAYLVQALWVLPIFAWLMLVSSWTNRTPFLVALLGPLAPVVLEGVLFQTSTIATWIAHHISWVVLPHPHQFNDEGVRQSVTMADSLSYLATLELWTGVVVGVLLMAATVYFRRMKNEI